MKSQFGDQFLDVVLVFQGPFELAKHGEAILDFKNYRLDILNLAT